MQPSRPQASRSKVVQLDQVSVPRLFFALLHQRFTGTAQLEQPAPQTGRRAVWFSGGMPVYTDWAEPTDVLGQVLVELQLITPNQLLKGLETMAADGGLLGQILIRQNTIDNAALADGLRRQCSRKLARLFSMREGTVTVTAGQHDIQGMQPVNVLELILSGVGSNYDETRVKAELGEALHTPVVATAALHRYHPHFRFRDTDVAAVRALARGTDLKQLAEQHGVSTRRGAQLIFTLWSCQMLRIGGATKAAKASSRPPSPAPTKDRSSGPLSYPGSPVTPGRIATIPPSPKTQSATKRPASPSPGPQTASTGGRRGTAPMPVHDPTQTEMAEDETGFVAQLEEVEHRIASGQHAFDILGLEVSAGKREVRRAWTELSRAYHPDALQARGLGHLRERVGRAFAALSEAQVLLMDKETREKIRKRVEAGEDPNESDDATHLARAAFESDLIAKDADKLLKAGKFERALERYTEASQLNLADLDIKAAMLWCRYNLSSRDRTTGTEAEQGLGAIVDEQPKLARAHYFRGMILRDLGAAEAAIIAFGFALQHDPRLIDAERQARALRASKGLPLDAGPKKKSGWGGLFGKK